MAEAHLDHPGDVSWFKGYSPLPVQGDCPHGDCPHDALSVIAWGPDFDHYELVVCDVPLGCAGRCRGWSPGRTAGPFKFVGHQPGPGIL